jgi:succinate dehydrogenase / fumarate reductase, membrane anchor subunit
MSRLSGSPIGRVLGRGSAHEGAHHWWMQRVTAIALLPLTLWFLISLLLLPDWHYGTVATWIGTLSHGVLLALLLLCLCWHSQLGVQVVIEDYVHRPAIKVASLLVVSFAHVLLATAGVFSIIRLVVSGSH